MKKKCTETKVTSEATAAQRTGGDGGGTMSRAKGKGKADSPEDARREYPEGGRPNGDLESGEMPRETAGGAGEGIDGAVPPALPGPDAGAASDDAVFRDIITKAAEGNIKYQELYLKYIDLISGKMVDEDEVIYEATFIDDEDQEA